MCASIVQWRIRYGIYLVKHLPALPPRFNPDILQDFQMFLNRRLLHLHRILDFADRPLLHRQIVENVPSPRFRHRIERVVVLSPSNLDPKSCTDCKSRRIEMR
jgi:hypothetical protein